MKSRQPLISVLMPAYNHEKFVGSAIQSVLSQSYENFELVVVDDGSTDATLEVIRGFSDPRIRVVSQANQDAYNALNRCVDISTGEYLAIINSDDLYLPQRLGDILEELRSFGGVCAFTEVKAIDNTDNDLPASHPWRKWYEKLKRAYTRSTDLYEAFLNGNLMVTSSNLFFHRSVSDGIGGFRKLRFLHDYEFIFRILRQYNTRTLFLRRELLMYRVHPGNTIASAGIAGRRENVAVVLKYLYDRFPEDYHGFLDAGIDRLLVLQREMMEIQSQCADA